MHISKLLVIDACFSCTESLM